MQASHFLSGIRYTQSELVTTFSNIDVPMILCDATAIQIALTVTNRLPDFQYPTMLGIVGLCYLSTQFYLR